MADDLSDSLDSLRFLVARPGTFSQFYPETTDEMVLQTLIDGLAEAHLMGLLMDTTSDEDGILNPPLASGQLALVLLFSAVRFLRSELINRNTTVRYKAGSAEYETSQGVNLLRDLLASLQKQLDKLIDNAEVAGGSAIFYMADQYLARVCCDWHPGQNEHGW